MIRYENGSVIRISVSDVLAQAGLADDASQATIITVAHRCNDARLADRLWDVVRAGVPDAIASVDGNPAELMTF